jgi:YVTN family beta-propeller protein
MAEKIKLTETHLRQGISGLNARVLGQLMRAAVLALCLIALGSVAAHAQSYTYVTNSDDDTLSLIYTATHEIKNPPVRAIIPLRPPGDTRHYNPVATVVTPYSVAGNATGQFVYTVNKDVNSVSVVDVVKSKLIQTINVGPAPVAIAISGVRLDPVGGECHSDNPLWRTFAYVVNSGNNTVSIIDTDPKSSTWNQVVRTLTVGGGPSAVAVSKPTLEQAIPNGMFFAAGFYVFVTNSTDNTVSVIGGDYRSGANGCGTGSPTSPDFNNIITGPGFPLDLTLPSAGRPGLKPVGISFERYGRWAYVVNSDSDNVTAIDTCFGVAETQGTCNNPFVPNFRVGKAIELNQGVSALRRNGAKPSAIAITIDLTGTYQFQNLRAYVPNSGDDSFSVLNIEANSANPNFQTTVFVCDRNDPNVPNPQACPKAGDKPTGLTIMYPDEDFVYITNYGSNSVAVIDSDPDSLGGPGGVEQYNHEVGRITRGIGMPSPGAPGSICQPPDELGRSWCGHPLGIANTPRIPYTYVMNSGSNTISVVGASPQIQEPPDPHPVLHTIPLNWSPTWVTLNRNQDFIFVADKIGGKVHVINTMAQIEVGSTNQNIGMPLRLATPPDGWSVYVASNDGSIYTVDTVDRSGPGGPGDPFQAGGGTDVTFPIPGEPGFAPMVVSLRECPRANPVAPCAGQVSGGGGSGNGGNQGGGGAGNGGSTFSSRIPNVGSSLGGLDVHPDTFVGLVASKNTNEVVMFDTHYDNQTWNSVLGRVTLPVGSCPVAVAFTHRGTRALVMNSNHTLSLLNTSGNRYRHIKTIRVGRGPVAVAFSELDEFAYVVNSLDGTVSVIRMSDFSVLPPPAGSPPMPAKGTIKVGSNPQDIFINLGERSGAYVTNKSDNTVSIIDVMRGSPGFNRVVETVNLINVNHNPPTPESTPVGIIITEP